MDLTQNRIFEMIFEKLNSLFKIMWLRNKLVTAYQYSRKTSNPQGSAISQLLTTDANISHGQKIAFSEDLIVLSV